MARTHERIETWDIPADRDQWESIRAADAYLRLQIGLREKCHAAVFDERGQIFEDDLFKAYTEWQKDPSMLKSVVISYADTTKPLSAQLHAKDLQQPPEADLFKPTLEVTVRGTDPAEVHGTAQEAVHKAKQGLAVPKIEVPKIEMRKVDLPESVERPPASDIPFADLAPQPSRASQVINHPWMIATGSALIAGLIILILTLWLT